MSDEKVLTKEIAEQFLAHEDFVDLSEFTSIEDEAVEILRKQRRPLAWQNAIPFWPGRGTLELNGLTELSDAAAESLGKHRGDLHLDGLTTRSDAAADSLGRLQGGRPGWARWFVFYRRKYKRDLHLDGLTELSDVAAESLSKHKGWLSLDGLTELSDAAAESLSKHKGDLHLNGLKELSDAVAESLSKQPAERDSWFTQTFNLLFSSEASFCSRYINGDLSLEGLTEFSDAASESLGKHKGDLYLELDKLPESAAKILRDADHIRDPARNESLWTKTERSHLGKDPYVIAGIMLLMVLCITMMLLLFGWFLSAALQKLSENETVVASPKVDDQLSNSPVTADEVITPPNQSTENGWLPVERPPGKLFKFVEWVVTRLWKRNLLVPLVLLQLYFLNRAGRKWAAEKVAADKKRVKRQERRKLESEKITEKLKEHGISKYDLPAIICHCHSCSRVSVVTQKCVKCGLSARKFEQISDTSGSTTALACPCGWKHETFTCPCGIENSAVRFGLYVIEETGDGGRHTLLGHHCGMRC